MIQVFRVPLSKDQLRALSKEERVLFFLLGYVANQISMFQKLVTFSTNKTPSDPIEQKLTGANTQMLARFMVGVLNEGWRLVHKRFLQKPIGSEYLPLLDQKGQEALTNLKEHFAKSKLMGTIRNDFAYHHPSDDDVEAAFAIAASDAQWDQDWNWYFSDSTFNSFYFPCDLVILHGILNAVQGTDLVGAQQKIMGEIRKVSDLLMDFIPAFLAAIWRKHFGPDMPAEICANVEGAPSLWDVWIPFFVEVAIPPTSEQEAAP